MANPRNKQFTLNCHEPIYRHLLVGCTSYGGLTSPYGPTNLRVFGSSELSGKCIGLTQKINLCRSSSTWPWATDLPEENQVLKIFWYFSRSCESITTTSISIGLLAPSQRIRPRIYLGYKKGAQRTSNNAQRLRVASHLNSVKGHCLMNYVHYSLENLFGPLVVIGPRGWLQPVKSASSSENGVLSPDGRRNQNIRDPTNAD